MKFPKLISVKDFLISPSSGTFDKKKFILKAYEIFSNDFKEDNVLFEGNPVLIRDKILDCTVCNNSCGNDFCTCNDCPWKGKEDIFQHLTSDKDPNMEQRLTKNAKQKQRKMRKTNPRYEIRTPGIFSKTRTNRIAWIKFMIEKMLYFAFLYF